MSNTDLYLVRHAQAVVNVTGTMAGPKGDTGLTPLGVSQAELLRDRLARTQEICPDVFLASSLPRARQTAEILLPAVGFSPVHDDDLHEFRVGPDADGLDLEEYKRRFGWIDFESEPHRETDPGGESWFRFQSRVSQTIQRITDEHAGKKILCVTHGGVIDGSFLHFFGLPLDVFPSVRLHTQNTSITQWRRERRDGKLGWKLVRYNDDAHLRGI